MGRNIRIRQYTFELTDVFATGHQITEAEAFALNTLRAENIRNNVSRKVLEEAEKLPYGTLLPVALLETLQSYITDYADTYQFALPTVVKNRVGALEREIQYVAEIAVAQVMEVTDPGWDAALERAKGLPEIKEEARRRLEAKQAIAQSSIEELLG